MEITEYRVYEEAKANFEWSQAWELFDGDQKNFNIAHECIDRHPREETAIRIKFEDGHSEQYSFGRISTLSSQLAYVLESRGISFADRVAIMLDPSLEFYASLFGTLKRGAIVVPCFSLFGPDALNQRLEDSGAKMLVTTKEKTSLVNKASTVGVMTIDHQFNQLLDKQPDKYEPKTSANDLSVDRKSVV
jgi:acetyl-CoA synthetase